MNGAVAVIIIYRVVVRLIEKVIKVASPKVFSRIRLCINACTDSARINMSFGDDDDRSGENVIIIIVILVYPLCTFHYDVYENAKPSPRTVFRAKNTCERPPPHSS